MGKTIFYVDPISFEYIAENQDTGETFTIYSDKFTMFAEINNKIDKNDWREWIALWEAVERIEDEKNAT